MVTRFGTWSVRTVLQAEDFEEDIQALGIRGWRKIKKERKKERRLKFNYIHV
jgi:hypothetical protein